jgi:tetratricopeptide (TPR) repeat protein
LVVLAGLTGFAAGETYRLDAEQGLQDVAGSPENEYLLAVSEVKQQLMAGSSKEVIAALEQLKADFPDLAGEPIDTFIKGEKLYAKSTWHKAAVEYKTFVTSWPESVLYPVAIERYFSIGVAYLQGEKRRFLGFLKLPAFDDGEKIIWDIADREGTSQTSLRALTTLAQAQEKKKKYFDAYQTWAEIATRWPTGKTGQDALLRMAQQLHASYRGPQFDAGSIKSAKSYYEDFMERYPELATQLNIQAELDLIEEQLAYKSYEQGFYYERTKKPEAAEMYYDKVVAEWPDSEAASMVAIRRGPTAPPVYKRTRVRKLFDVSNRLLDGWFGIEGLFDKFLPEDGETADMSPDILGEEIKQ